MVTKFAGDTITVNGGVRVRDKDGRMRSVGWIAFALAVASLICSGVIVLSNQVAMAQLGALRFPLTELGEATLGMVLPIGLSTLSTIMSALLIRRRVGRVAFATSVVSWILIWAILGISGFRYLF